MCAAAGAWTFLVWRLAGMPDPGGMGRFLPGAWILCGILSVGRQEVRGMGAAMAAFTGFALMWRCVPWGHPVAAAVSVAGLLHQCLQTAGERRGLIRGILPAALLMAATVPFTSDEVRFSEIAAQIGGADSFQFRQRPGDPAPGDSHHTLIYPVLLAPGAALGPPGIRAMGLLPVIAGALLLRLLLERTGAGDPGRTAAAAVLLMPGFTLLGPAMTGWPAAAAVCGFALLPKGWRGLPGTAALGLFLVAMKMRYAGAAGGMILVWFLENTRSARVRILVPLAMAGLAAGVLVLDRLALNGALVWTRYGNTETLMALRMNLFHRPGVLLQGTLHMMLDFEAGLLPKAPWVLAALTGLPLLRRADGTVFRRLALPGVMYAAVHLLWTGDAWHGLPAPATRVFMPLLPLLAAGLSRVWDRSATRLLTALSLAIAALTAAIPGARFNMAQGTDNLLAAMSVQGQWVSMVRPDASALAIWALLAGAAAALCRLNHGTGLRTLLLGGALLLAVPWHSGRFQAEEAGPERVHGAGLYPADPDPSQRQFWFFSRERLLVLDHPYQSVSVDGPGTLRFWACGGTGAVLLVGGDTLEVESELLPLPDAYIPMRRSSEIPDRPENRELTEFILDIRGPLEIRVPPGGTPVYLDWVEVTE
jgi:hypothetical protein